MPPIVLLILSLLLALFTSGLFGQEPTEQEQSPYNTFNRSASTYQWIAGFATGTAFCSGAVWALSGREIGSPLLLAAGGVVVGPAIGYVAGNEFVRGIRGAAFRASILAGTGALVVFIAVAEGLRPTQLKFDGWNRPEVKTTAAILGSIGGAIVLAMAVTDIIDLEEIIQRQGRSVAIAPAIGKNGVGLMARIEF